jgi:hypothetical protein
MTQPGDDVAAAGRTRSLLLRGRGFEIGAAVLTASGKFVFSDWLGYQLHYTVAAIVFWAAYVTLRHNWDPSILKRWGFTRKGLKQGLTLGAGAFVVGLGVSLLYGASKEVSIINWNLPLLMLLYPVWGIVQQFLVVGLFADNVIALSRGRIPEFVVVMIAALLFAAVHVPDRELMVATFCLGIVSVLVFFKTRNLIAVGILHGWFASVFYFFAMGEDPLAPLITAAFG